VRPLTLKQQRFVEAYLGPSQGNATDAARRARYSGNAKTLGVVGAENLAKPSIRAAIKRDLKRGAMPPDEILQRVSDLARSDPLLYDPFKPLQLIGKYHGLWNRPERALRKRFLDLIKRKIEGKPDEFKLADLVAEAEARAEQRKKER